MVSYAAEARRDDVLREMTVAGAGRRTRELWDAWERRVAEGMRIDSSDEMVQYVAANHPRAVLGALGLPRASARGPSTPAVEAAPPTPAPAAPAPPDGHPIYMGYARGSAGQARGVGYVPAPPLYRSPLRPRPGPPRAAPPPPPRNESPP